MVRGIEGTPVFKDKEDREQFLHHVGELAQATETRIAAWALPCLGLLSYNGHKNLLPPAWVRSSAVAKAINKREAETR
jgi:hypothetical protein